METEPLKTEEPLITAEQLQKTLPSLKRGTIYRMAKTGLLDGCYYVGEQRRGVRFRLSEVLASLKQRPVATTVTLKAQGKGTKKGKAAKAATGKTKA